MEFGRLLLLKYAIGYIAFYIAAQISISDEQINLKKITYEPYSIVIVCLLSYIIHSGCCHVSFLLCKSLNMYALAETHVVCVTTASPFLRCQVYIPSLKHISKGIYFQFYLSIYTLGGCTTLYITPLIFSPLLHEDFHLAFENPFFFFLHCVCCKPKGQPFFCFSQIL